MINIDLPPVNIIRISQPDKLSQDTKEGSYVLMCVSNRVKVTANLKKKLEVLC